MDKVLNLMRDAARLMAEVDRAEVSVKGRSNFVTDRDVAVQEKMRAGLSELYPDYGFFSEEQENSADFSRPTWILDPIDGTANFITHCRQSAISLALYREGRVEFGAVYNPFTDEMFTAERGKGAYLNGAPIHTDDGVELQQALIELGTMPYYKDRAHEVGRMAAEILLRASDLRRCGSAALAMCYVAEGRLGGMIEGILQPWDFAAGMLIAAEAGAVVCDWNGEPLDPRAPSSVLAGTQKIFKELLALIADTKNSRPR